MVLTSHWYVGVGVPLAAPVKVTAAGAVTVWLSGCVVMLGATGVGLTVNVAALLVAAGATPLDATNSYSLLLKAVVVELIV